MVGVGVGVGVGIPCRLFLLLLLTSTCLCDDSVVKISTGLIQGNVTTNSRRFLGIPFAQPPIGQLRWKEPLQASAWDGVKQTTAYGPECIQPGGAKQSEDCLSINVFAPRETQTKKALAVMLFFYGGCWEMGQSSNALYNGEYIVELNPNVIVVTSNYRVGVFGFLGSKSLAAESPTGTTGNYGLLDQRLAMQWVHVNIAAFQGNPDNVMIFGESAGAGSVANHLIMPKSWPLFQLAGMESGPIAVWTARPLERVYSQYEELVSNAGCQSSDPQLEISCLKSKDAATILKVSPHSCGKYSTCCWAPTVDLVEILDTPQSLAKQGKINKVPVLLGSNKNEGTIFMSLPHDVNDTTYTAYVYDMYGTEIGQKVLQYYPSSDFKSPWWAAVEIWSDHNMICPARRTAQWISELQSPVFLYFFTHEILEVQILDPYLGVFHASELPFVFNVPLAIPFILTPEEKQLQIKFATYWSTFAQAGDPNKIGLPYWPVYNSTNDADLNLNLIPQSETGLKKNVCNLWDTIPDV